MYSSCIDSVTNVYNILWLFILYRETISSAILILAMKLHKIYIAILILAMKLHKIYIAILILAMKIHKIYIAILILAMKQLPKIYFVTLIHLMM